MTPNLAFALGSVVVLGLYSAAEAVGGGAPPVALSVSPARLAIVAPASRTIELRNLGTERVVVDVARRSADRSPSKEWLRIRPSRLVLGARSRAVLTLRAAARRRARPGDHQILVLFVARALDHRRVTVRVRLGVGVRIRMPGRIVRRLAVRNVRVRRHDHTRELLVSVANRGNVTEQLGGRLTVALIRRGRLLSRLRLRGLHELLPGSRAVFSLQYTGHARGLVTAVVRTRLGGRPGLIERRYRLRL